VAFAILALVVDCAGLVVVAGQEVGFVDAALFPLAGVVGAGVGIVANYWGAKAVSIITVVGDGAGVAVCALSARLRFIETAVIAQAGVCSTGVVIVAGILVYLAVAVVVESVAGIFGWQCRVAVSKAPFLTEPLSLTAAEVVLLPAVGPKRVDDGCVGAGADSAFGNALH